MDDAEAQALIERARLHVVELIASHVGSVNAMSDSSTFELLEEIGNDPTMIYGVIRVLAATASGMAEVVARDRVEDPSAVIRQFVALVDLHATAGRDEPPAS